MSTDVVEVEGQGVGQSLRHGDESVPFSEGSCGNVSSCRRDPNNIYNLVLNEFKS